MHNCDTIREAKTPSVFLTLRSVKFTLHFSVEGRNHQCFLIFQEKLKYFEKMLGPKDRKNKIASKREKR